MRTRDLSFTIAPSASFTSRPMPGDRPRFAYVTRKTVWQRFLEVVGLA